MHPVLIYIIWAAQESVLDFYPSIELSSAVVVGCPVVQVFDALWGTRKDFTNFQRPIAKRATTINTSDRQPPDL